MKHSTRFVFLLFLLFGWFGLIAQTAPVLVNTFDSEGIAITGKYQVFQGPNYKGEYDAGTPVSLEVGATYKLFAHYMNTSTERVVFTVTEEGNTFNFSTTKVKFHWSGGYLDYRGSGSWKGFSKTDGSWDAMELFPNDFYGNMMQFQFGYKWNDKRFITVAMDFAGKTSIEKVVSQLQLLDHAGQPIAGGKARGGYASPTVWHVNGETNAAGLLLDLRDGSNSNLSYEMRINGSASQSAQQESSFYVFQTQLLTLRLQTCEGTPLDGGVPAFGSGSNAGTSFFPGGATGSSVAGESSAELFPGTFSFRMQYQSTTEYKMKFNFPADGNTLTWTTTNVSLIYGGEISYGGSTGDSKFFTKPSMELLAGTYTFHFRGSQRVDLTIEGCSMKKGLIHVKLVDSNNNGLEGGIATYYNSGWKSIGTTDANGNVFMMLDGDKTKFSFNMKWAGYTQQLSNVDISSVSPVLFQTLPMVVRLENSSGVGIEGGQAIYYASGWKTFGTTDVNGNASLELLPGKYSFQMKYLGYSKQISNVPIETTNPLVYSTIPMVVELRNSNGDLIDEGDVIYYASGWKEFGKTSGGIVTKELLPGKYSFQMKYEGYSLQKSNVDIETVNPLEFKTEKMEVQLLNSSDNPLEGGVVIYYASGWKSFGITDATGSTFKELLPGKYSFQMKYEGYSQQMSNIDIATVNPLLFRTEKMEVKLLNSSDNPLVGGVVIYYASGWKSFGTTDANGSAFKELLPGKYSFQMKYAGYSQQMSNVNISSVNPLVYKTMAMVVSLKTCAGVGLEGGAVIYYASGWKPFGTTDVNGTASLELLPGKYSFQMKYNGQSQQKSNVNISDVSNLEYLTTKVTLAYDGVIKFYASGWKVFNKPSMEMLPANYSFRFDNLQKKLNVSGCSFSGGLITLTDENGNPMANYPTEYPVETRILNMKHRCGGSWAPTTSFQTDAKGQAWVNVDCDNWDKKVTVILNQTSKEQNLLENSTFQLTKVNVNLSTCEPASPLAGGIVDQGGGYWFNHGVTDATGSCAFYAFDGNGIKVRMSYNYGSITHNSVPVIAPVTDIDFTTTTVNFNYNGTIKLKTGGWPVISMPIELLPGTYGFKFGSDEVTGVVIDGCSFDKAPVFVQLKSSGGSGLPNAGFSHRIGWGGFTDIGIDDSGSGLWCFVDGNPTKLKVKVDFKGAALEKEQTVQTNNKFIFNAVNVTADLKDSNNGNLSADSWEYRYGWGTYTSLADDGEELLPVNTKVKVAYKGATVEKEQNVGSSSHFAFNTVNVTADLYDSGNNILEADSWVYRYGWGEFSTLNHEGEELLPVNVKVRVEYKGATVEKEQNVSSASVYQFNTVNATAELKNSEGVVIDADNWAYRYGWGAYSMFNKDGEELLPVNVKVQVGFKGTSVEKEQNISSNSLYAFNTVKVTADLKDDDENLLNADSWQYRYGWGTFFELDNIGEELLPVSLKVKATYDGIANEKEQNAASNPYFSFTWNGTAVKSGKMNSAIIDNSEIVSEFSMALYPVPARDKLTANVIMLQDEQVVYRIVDMAGRTMSIEKTLLLQGQNVINIDVDNYYPGQYLFVLTTGDKIHTHKFIVEN